ncbi:MAG: hypothetical protein RJB66_2318 [Pseudomonadota bacterium]|jgi:release factor glutamine methyltransferase
MKVKEVFEKSVQFLRDKKIESPRLETELLLASVLQTDRIGIYLKYEAPLTDTEVGRMRELVVRKSKGEPTAYLLGEKYFFGRRFAVGPGVLIPRPETEMIVEDLVRERQNGDLQDKFLVADWGAGSGCLGLSIGLEFPKAQITLVERSPAAFGYCSKNLESLVTLEDRQRFQLVNGSVEDWNSGELMSLVVANPPYIDFQDTEVLPAVRQFEPHEALFAEEKGLAALKSWIAKAALVLAPGGRCYFEIGYQQGPTVKEFFEAGNAFCKVEILKDFNKLDRIVKAVKNG